MTWCNYDAVVHQLEQLLDDHGLKWKNEGERHLKIDAGRKNYGKGSKCWYRLYTFAPRNSTNRYVVGAYGCWKDGRTFKVEWDKEGLSEEAREAYRAQQAAARERERREAEESAALAAMSARDLWALAVAEGSSPYLERKGVEPESCRFLDKSLRLGRRDPQDKPISLPAGTLVLPLIRYDKPREEALRGLQFIKPDGFKVFTEGFAMAGCATRLGKVEDDTRVVLFCEGFATGLTIRKATGRRWPVYVALNTVNLGWVVELLRDLHPDQHFLLCADDDWKTKNHAGPNPGRTAARAVAKTTPRCDIVWPVFNAATRQDKDTDFNDLQLREGLQVVEQQLQGVLSMMQRGVRRGR